MTNVYIIEKIEKLIKEAMVFAVIFCIVAVFVTVISAVAHGDVKVVALVILLIVYVFSNLMDNGK